MRQSVVKALSKLPAEALTALAPAIAQRLEHKDSGVRQSAAEVLGRLPAEAKSLYEGAINVQRLEDMHEIVRRSAVVVLCKLPAEALTALAPAIMQRLEHKDSGN